VEVSLFVNQMSKQPDIVWKLFGDYA